MDAREFKITFMLSLVLGYFCVEMFVGYRYNSLALVADACHMLSDGLCLVVALGTVFDINLSKKRSFSTLVQKYSRSKMSTESSENLVQSCPENSETIQSWAGSEGK